MKSLLLLVAISLLTGCATRTEKSASGNSPGQTNVPEAAKSEKPAQSKTATSDVNAPPVDFTFLGITPDKTSISYKIKVNTDKPIEEVHLALKETDAGGKVVEQIMIAWQNIVHSTQQPIEKGKTYEDQTPLDPAAVKAECTLKEVIFKDGTRWTAH
jgi:hypothetical protein